MNVHGCLIISEPDSHPPVTSVDRVTDCDGFTTVVIRDEVSHGPFATISAAIAHARKWNAASIDDPQITLVAESLSSADTAVGPSSSWTMSSVNNTTAVMPAYQEGTAR
jgi:hypothetical protein